jgi:dipeptidyl aminopeptidase/acylaminoacyl peptidase
MGSVLSPPLWSPDGRTLYVVNRRREVEAITLDDSGADVQVTTRRTLFAADDYWFLLFLGWDISPDGSRFVMLRRPPTAKKGRLFAIAGPPTLLERKAAAR